MFDRQFVHTLALGIMIIIVALAAGIYDTKQGNDISELRLANRALSLKAGSSFRNVRGEIVSLNAIYNKQAQVIRGAYVCAEAVEVKHYYTREDYAQCLLDFRDAIHG